MTPPQEERLEIISKAHLLGHFGINAIEKTIHNDYKLHWSNMRNDIQEVVNDCHACQAFNIRKVGYHPPRSVVPDGVFDHVCIDLGDFSTTSTSGNKFMLVVVDYFSRYTILRALPNKSGETIARSLLQIFCSYGFPRKITSDRGSEFVNDVVNEFVKMSGIDRRLSLPYTPTGNSVAESFVGICKRSIIKALAADAADPESWNLYLDAIQYAVNCQYTRLHKSRPFAVMFNRQPNDFIDYTKQIQPQIDIEKSDTKLLNEKFKYVKEVVIPSIAKRIQDTQSIDHKNFMKTHKIIEHKFSINTKVLVLNPHRNKSKLIPRWLGPFLVHGYTKNGSYILKDLTGELLSRDVNVQHLAKLKDGSKCTPDDREKEYEVQAIVDDDVDENGEPIYLVNWVGYP
ncbi:MAG: DDE-type integrase/transposase/recombinase, partial [Anaerorhabdus sp.]